MPRHALAFFASTLLTTAAVATAAAAAAGVEPSPRVVEFLGQPAVDVLRGATRVETFLLKDERADEGEPSVGRYAIASAGAPRGEAFARRLADALLDERTYRFDAAKRRVFQSQVGFRIWKGGVAAAVEVVLCFDSDELIVHAPKAADGSVRGAFEDFDAARPALVKLAKEAFPDDKGIRGLKE